MVRKGSGVRVPASALRQLTLQFSIGREPADLRCSRALDLADDRYFWSGPGGASRVLGSERAGAPRGYPWALRGICMRRPTGCLAGRRVAVSRAVSLREIQRGGLGAVRLREPQRAARAHGALNAQILSHVRDRTTALKRQPDTPLDRLWWALPRSWHPQRLSFPADETTEQSPRQNRPGSTLEIAFNDNEHARAVETRSWAPERRHEGVPSRITLCTSVRSGRGRSRRDDGPRPDVSSRSLNT